MSKIFEISEFKFLPLSEKIDFLESNFINSVKNLNEKSITLFMRGIILDVDENLYVRKSTLEFFTEFVIIGKLKSRHALSLLIDSWLPGSDVFLEVQRLKDLMLFYEEESEEIESIYKNNINETEAEIVSESFFNLGIISFKKALIAVNEDSFFKELSESSLFFNKSAEEIENRIDSRFYQKIILILKEIKVDRYGSAKQYISELSNDLFKQEVFSFSYNFDNLQYSFYKMLVSLQKICDNQPDKWLDFKFELDSVYINYLEITDSKVKQRLNEKSIVKGFGEYLNNKILKPYFCINFSSEIVRLDLMLRELPKGTGLYNFLLHLKIIVENTDKKKEELFNLEKKFKKLFIHKNPVSIEKVISEINNPIDYLSAVELFLGKTNDSLISALMFSCSKLQGDKIYLGTATDENDKNRYVAALLEAKGFNVKDQPQWSTSAEGKNSGEVDIFITEKDGTPKSIIEALILNSLKVDYLKLHLDKLFKYDTTGLENNYIVTYSTAKNFISLWDKYKKFISKHKYTYDFVDFDEINDFRFADIKIGVARHLRNGKTVNLYHVMINMVER